MEPSAGGRPVLQVVGEDEALQQFFDGQYVTDVLESSVAMDTSILEQYLTNNYLDSNSSMLPESPPDSSSEPCSPPQVSDLHYRPTHWSNAGGNQDPFHPTTRRPTPSSCSFQEESPNRPALLTHAQLQSMGLMKTCVRAAAHPAEDARQLAPTWQHAHLHAHLHARQPVLASYQSSGGYAQAHTAPPPPPHRLHKPLPPQPPTAPSPAPPVPPGCTGATATGEHTGSPDQHVGKRRRLCSGEVGMAAFHCESDGGGANLGPGHLLSWDSYRPVQWHRLSNSSYQMLPVLAFHVETDKGFVYSVADEAFVCQKKNHFQVTVHVGVAGEPRYVTTASGPQLIDHFQVNVFGIKQEASSQQVTIEQSKADRSKRPFHPLRIDLPGDKITKVTLGRLHFSETTANNMRKKGRPNPDQRYFQMVVGLYAAAEQQRFLLAALRSERIIVRASNPGQFEMDSDTLWQRGALQDAVVCQGRVGINTDSPDEALVVCGNAKVMGTVMHPSDCRAKDNIQEVNSEDQLRRIAQMRIVEYDYKPEFASSMGIDHTHQTGIIAQEVKELLPTAVKEVGDVTCSDGEKIHNFLMVDKEQIFMENVGAVQQLCKLTDDLDSRIKDLEVWNGRLAKLRSLTGSMRSKGKSGNHTSVSSTQKHHSVKPGKESMLCMQHKVFQASVFTLLSTMALCVIFITALYLLTLREDESDFNPGDSGSNVFPSQTTTAWPTTTSPSPGHWPPDIDFCDLLYCEEVYCCPSTPGGSNYNDTFVNATEAPGGDNRPSIIDEGKKKLFEDMQNARDWTNTTIHTFLIKENQQVIDSRYLDGSNCGPGRFSYEVPISQYVPVNMRITLVMNSTELLVVHLCGLDESAACAALMDMDSIVGSRYPANTQGVHEWPLHVSRLHYSSYHFRSTVAGQADCSTDRHAAGAFFTDYHFYFYRYCTD